MLRALCVCVVAAFALAASGCSERIREVAPTPQLVKEIGLPLYPNSKPTARAAREVTMSSQLGVTRAVVLSYETTDGFAKVRQFYEDRLPRNKRELSIPMGQFNNVTMQFTDPSGRKQVQIMSFQGMTMIQLESTTLTFTQPSAEPSAAPTSPR